MISSFDLYRVFYYVGKHKNITHAASSLFISQSTVSRCIKSLETELNCRLLDRSQHGVEFTPEGAVLFKHVEEACENIFAGEERIRQMQEFGEGSIKIGVNDFTFQQYVLPVIKDFHRDFPGVRLEVTYLSGAIDNNALDSVADGRLNFLCMSMYKPPARAELQYEIATKFSDVIIAGRDFDKLREGEYTFSELLSSFPFVAQTGDETFFDKILDDKAITAEPAFRVNSVSMFLPMVIQGLCLAVIPDTYLIETPDVFNVALKDPLPERNIWIVSSKASRGSSAQEELIRRIKRFSRSRADNSEINKKIIKYN